MGSDLAAGLGDVEALSLLADGTRRRLYEFVARSDRPVSRDECAQAVRLDRSLAAYHLEKLLEHGYLEASYARPPGWGGPGAGRPPKLYRRSARELASAVPARNYRLLADLVAAAADEADATVREAIEHAAGEMGRSLGHAASDGRPRREEALRELLRRQGYEPYEAEPGLLRLRNCPFDAVASRHPRLVCGLNLALIEGMLSGLGAESGDAAPAPQEGCCCVAIRTPARAGDAR